MKSNQQFNNGGYRRFGLSAILVKVQDTKNYKSRLWESFTKKFAESTSDNSDVVDFANTG
jgi:hypothetical protein